MLKVYKELVHVDILSISSLKLDRYNLNFQNLEKCGNSIRPTTKLGALPQAHQSCTPASDLNYSAGPDPVRCRPFIFRSGPARLTERDRPGYPRPVDLLVLPGPGRARSRSEF